MVTTSPLTPAQVSTQYLLRTGYQSVDPSLTLLRYWHGRLNRLLFQGKLGKCKLTYGESEEKNVDGLFYEDGPHIHIDARIKTRKALIDTLAHEMIHQFQHQQRKPTTHNAMFKRMAKRFIKYGIDV